MTVLVDTSVWSLALRRDMPPAVAEIDELRRLLAGNELVVSTGIILQELLQGFAGPSGFDTIVEQFAAMPLIEPRRDDYIAAAAVRNTCRRAGVQLGTVDALIAHLCIREGLTLLTTDNDFRHAAGHVTLRVWSPR